MLTDFLWILKILETNLDRCLVWFKSLFSPSFGSPIGSFNEYETRSNVGHGSDESHWHVSWASTSILDHIDDDVDWFYSMFERSWIRIWINFLVWFQSLFSPNFGSPIGSNKSFGSPIGLGGFAKRKEFRFDSFLFRFIPVLVEMSNGNRKLRDLAILKYWVYGYTGILVWYTGIRV